MSAPDYSTEMNGHDEVDPTADVAEGERFHAGYHQPTDGIP